MSDEEMEQLANLSPDHFGNREWVALEWARTWALSRGDVVDTRAAAEFEALYSEQERRDILAVVTSMDFANRFMNSTSGEVLHQAPGEAQLDRPQAQP